MKTKAALCLPTRSVAATCAKCKKRTAGDLGPLAVILGVKPAEKPLAGFFKKETHVVTDGHNTNFYCEECCPEHGRPPLLEGEGAK